MKGENMAAITYTKANRIAEADIQKLDDGKFQGVVLITYKGDGAAAEQSQHIVDNVSDTPQEALDEAKALAHRILGEE
jgi:hypothetical protein